MCRTVACMALMRGLPSHILAGLMAQLPPEEQPPEQEHAVWLEKTKAKFETLSRASEIAKDLLQKEPPEEGAKLVALGMLAPHSNADKIGVASIVTYELPSGAYLVIGTDHLTQEKVEHTTPNQHGVDGLEEATRQELFKMAIANLEAAEASAKASQPEEAPQA